ncbi:FecCD family ABC transporter permease [Candidatus Arthromitus sp. SFB-rat-Yit]|uniref:FecCD family ABC transporter permease n=1 Tax=Candidatus Arthromitus sp. SFB-rat-Yit TaxID=1041504 RepID=UPI000227A48C|nr:iron ABC transporter permease [Candidatus Arthromitus sp. SFB-rat-Yit]BAK81552.1 putative ferrichrome transport system permease protein FhuG [Candidatus Arthromitus sp. SFB-rat-Yit]
MKKSSLFFLISSIILILSILLYLNLGSFKITITDIFKTFLGQGTSSQNFAIFNLRLPRVILAIIVAFSLSISGVIFQTTTKNPLAEPGIIGINSGAALFVILLISSNTTSYYSKLPISTILLIPLVAITGAMFSMILIYVFAYKKQFKPIKFILTGIAINTGFSAIISFYQLSVSKGDYNQVLTWICGSLWGSNWNYIILTLPFILILTIIALIKGKTLDILTLGDELSYGVGVNVKKEMALFIFIASLLAAIATSVAGNIAFLGFIAPHISKSIIGYSHRKIILLSGIIGSIILVLSDALAKNLFSPIEIPVGIIVSILSVPYFIFLIIKDRRFK